VHGTQLAVATSHAGVAPVHLLVLVAEQTPQAPDAWQAGVAPPHSLSPAQERQVCVARLQTGVVPPHCAFEVQGTQVPAPALQTGVAPAQSEALLAEHCPHAPDGWQAGVLPPQSASAAQARQACVVVLQTGVLPPHWASVTQGTQVPVAVRQIGVAPPHADALVAEHCPQAPLGSQAGVVPPHSVSPAQARQT